MSVAPKLLDWLLEPKKISEVQLLEKGCLHEPVRESSMHNTVSETQKRIYSIFFLSWSRNMCACSGVGIMFCVHRTNKNKDTSFLGLWKIKTAASDLTPKVDYRLFKVVQFIRRTVPKRYLRNVSFCTI